MGEDTPWLEPLLPPTALFTAVVKFFVFSSRLTISPSQLISCCVPIFSRRPRARGPSLATADKCGGFAICHDACLGAPRVIPESSRRSCWGGDDERSARPGQHQRARVADLSHFVLDCRRHSALGLRSRLVTVVWHHATGARQKSGVNVNGDRVRIAMHRYR